MRLHACADTHSHRVVDTVNAGSNIDNVVHVTIQTFYCISCTIQKLIKSTYEQQNQLSIHMGIVRPRRISVSHVILLSPKVLAPSDRDSVLVLGRVTLATPNRNPGYLHLSNPRK
jgi:hypothetical protein